MIQTEKCILYYYLTYCISITRSDHFSWTTI